MDREKRFEVAGALAALMRGDIGLAEVKSLRDRLFPHGLPSDDPLAFHALARLDKHWRCVPKRAPLQASPQEWEKLRRWIALLNTEIEWEQSAYGGRPHRQSKLEWLGCLALPVSVVALIAAARVYDGLLVVAWVGVGVLLGLVAIVYVLWSIHVEETSDPKPFGSVDQLNRCIGLVDEYDLPSYDSRIHGLRATTRVLRYGPPYVANSIVLLVLFAALWPAMALFMFAERRRATQGAKPT